VTVYEPAYCSREDVQGAIDFRDGITADIQGRSDRAITTASRKIEGEFHRLYYPWDGTKWWDWPNYQWVSPWKLKLRRDEVLCLTSLVSGGVAIGLDQCFLRPANKRPGFPWTSIELDRSGSATFGGNSSTPQNAIMATGTWNFTADADQVTTLNAGIGSSDTTIEVASAGPVGVGDLLILGYGRGEAPFPGDALGHAGLIAPYLGERILVSGRQGADTGLDMAGSGCTTASVGDTQLQWSGTGTAPAQGEVLLAGTEQMLVLRVQAAVATVTRGFNGTPVQEHSGDDIWAYRSLTVQRGFLGTTAQSWDTATAVSKHRYPSLIRDLAIAEASVQILQETSGYARVTGSGESAVPASGAALAELWDEARTACGRMARIDAI
jgi:hypothetical protein